MGLSASSGMFPRIFWYHVKYKIVVYYCSLFKANSVAFSQFWNILLLFSDVSKRSSSTFAVFLGRQWLSAILECFVPVFWYHVEYKIVLYYYSLSQVDTGLSTSSGMFCSCFFIFHVANEILLYY